MKHNITTDWQEHQKHERLFHPGPDTAYWYQHILDSLPCWSVENKGDVLEIGAGEFGGFRSLVPCDSYAIVDPIWGDTDGPYGDLRIKAETLPMPDSTFDLVIISNAIDHCEQPGFVAREITRVLASGGSVLCGHYLNQLPHPWSFESVDEMPELFPGLTVRHKSVLADRIRVALDYKLSNLGLPPELFGRDVPSECAFGLVWMDKL